MPGGLKKNKESKEGSKQKQKDRKEGRSKRERKTCTNDFMKGLAQLLKS